LIQPNNQPDSIINNQYDVIEYKVDIAANLNYSFKQSIKDIVFEIYRKFCISDLAEFSTTLIHNAVKESTKSRVNNSNDSMMTVTVYYRGMYLYEG
jgi:hypothetical protein